jgi:16S rRNA (cytosine967-C5)-methyltransferase
MSHGDKQSRALPGSDASSGGPRKTSRGFVVTRPDPRAIAASVIERVLTDSAYAAAALSAALDRYPQLDERARALTTELVYTTLRTRRSLEAQLGAHAPRGLPKDPVLLAHLLVAAAQILHLDHRRAPVAVDVAVSQVSELRGPRMAGFANAILRRVVGTMGGFERAESLRQSCPAWLRERLIAVVGLTEAELLLGIGEGSDPRHPMTLRRRPGHVLPSWLAQAEPGRYSPLALRVTAVGDPRRLSGYAEGDFVIQEEGAQLIALALQAKPGERVLDACAGRGQKTSLLAEQVAPGGHVCATDLHPKKLTALNEELKRLGLSGVTTTAVDWTHGAGGGLSDDFDAALVDAPCTGTGTLRKRPEIAMRLAPGDLARLAELSTTIVRAVAGRVRAGGRIVYAVCSVMPEEGEGVVEAVGDLLESTPFEAPEVVRALGEGATMGRLLPGKHGTDGYFLANFRRR